MIAALSVGAGNLGGAREVFCAVDYWRRCGLDFQAWQKLLENPPSRRITDIWLPWNMHQALILTDQYVPPPVGDS